ncbi:MAG: hypothetical protein ABGY96_21900 [bacterium]|nr:hypothetical protein [Gammaproteobacteria bacterium]HIL97681.1 hypothetical protein [Pseudomonadales bacterium]
MSKNQRYTFGKTPCHTAAHNKISWEIIRTLLAVGPRTYDLLYDAMEFHEPGDKSKQPGHFIEYCIKHDWLVEVNHEEM